MITWIVLIVFVFISLVFAPSFVGPESGLLIGNIFGVLVASIIVHSKTKLKFQSLSKLFNNLEY